MLWRNMKMIFWKGEKFSLGGLILIIKNTIIIKENTNYVTSFYMHEYELGSLICPVIQSGLKIGTTWNYYPLSNNRQHPPHSLCVACDVVDLQFRPLSFLSHFMILDFCYPLFLPSLSLTGLVTQRESRMLECPKSYCSQRKRNKLVFWEVERNGMSIVNWFRRWTQGSTSGSAR